MITYQKCIEHTALNLPLGRHLVPATHPNFHAINLLLSYLDAYHVAWNADDIEIDRTEYVRETTSIEAEIVDLLGQEGFMLVENPEGDHAPKVQEMIDAVDLELEGYGDY